jgi:hypothetical protein
MHFRLSRITIIAVAAVGLSLTAQPARAAFTIDLGTTFTGADPSGSGPWITATFDQQNATTVRLTLTSNLNSSSEFISDWLFNFNPSKNLAGLSFAKISATVTEDPTIGKSLNGFQLNGPSGNFDISFSFATSNSGGGTKRFSQGDSVVYDISLAGGLLESDFNFGSNDSDFDPAPKSGAHVQGIANGGSGKISDGGNNNVVPAPAGLILLATAVPVFALRRLVRRKQVA